MSCVSEVLICWAAALDSGKGDGDYDIRAAFDEVQEDPKEAEIGIGVGQLWRWVGVFGKGRVRMVRPVCVCVPFAVGRGRTIW